MGAFRAINCLPLGRLEPGNESARNIMVSKKSG